MRNPVWQRDELILALDLYFKIDYNKLNGKHPEVVKLSQLLKRLPLFPENQRTETFRNAEGVYMKLGNFLSIDPNDVRKGLPSYSKLDKIIFYEFRSKQEELFHIAQTIKESVTDNSLYNLLEVANGDYDFEEYYAKEGKVVFRLHKLRERNVTLIKKKKKQVLEQTGKLACEACGFDFEATYGNLGEGFVECHHTKPISLMKLEDVTKLEDLVLVCSNCHRMLHRSPDASVELLRVLISRSNNTSPYYLK